MGLIGDWAKSRRMSDSVRGTLRVTACTTCDRGTTSGNYDLDGVVSADGVLPTAVSHSGIAKASKWPCPGDELPVTVDRADPTSLQIEWDEVQTGDERGAAPAALQAATMRGGAPAAAPDLSALTGMAGTTVSSQVFDLRDTGAREEILGAVVQHVGDPAQMRAAIMQTLAQAGIQLPDPAAGFPKTPGDGLKDPATRLRRLDALRDQQLVDADEYASLRAQILDDV
jgi:hypothetical protein